MSSAHIDLHLHSTASDGVLTPTELVRKARESGLQTIALTDHDNVDGVGEALDAGRQYEMEVIPGVELSIAHEKFSGIHVLGYYLDWRNAGLNEMLDKLRQVRANRGEMMLEKVNQCLIEQGRTPLEPAELKAAAQGAVGRPHISRLLVEKGYAVSQQDAFDRYLIPCDVPKMRLTPRQGIELIHEAKGIAVLAHPLNMTDERKPLRQNEHFDIIVQMIGWGIAGLELYYTGYQLPQIQPYLELARRHNLLLTAGSDFHQEDGQVYLGELNRNWNIPADIVPGLKQRYQEKYGHLPQVVKNT